MNVVFDTNVIISSTLWNNSVAQKLLFKLIQSDSKIFTSNKILIEYQKILKRDFEYSDEEIINIMEKVLSFVTLVEPAEKIDVVKDDPEDNKIIECAVESNAKHIITYDKHLLNLKEFRGIKAITPEEILGII
ncbi:MAG: putative toxin-antitoxin system toxin component, PIN family [Nanoarchaeota archaeon]|nr:putative toxin-antitoxin system toxin component, PIN family [Nanoarchaeota archaeon]